MSKSFNYSDVQDIGRQMLQGRKLQEWLAEMDGEWRLIPAPEGLFILQQLDLPRLTRRQGISLSGEVNYPGELTDILNLINTGRWSGDLHFIGDPIIKIISFKLGDVYNATSTAPEDRIGEVAARFGYITNDQLERARIECPQQEKLGAFMVRNEMITSPDLFSLVQKQAEEIFCSLLLVEKGQFYFYRADLPANLSTSFLLSTQSLLLEGVQRIDEMSYFREKIPSTTLIFERLVKKGTPLPLSETEQAILEKFDGKTSLARIAHKNRLGKFEVTKIAFKLLQAGFIKQVDSGSLGMKGTAAKKGGIHEVTAIVNEVFAQIYAEAKADSKHEELAQAAASYFDTTTVHSKLFLDVKLDDEGRIDPGKLSENAKSCDAEDKTEYVYQGLNEFLFFVTFIAGETLDEDALEQLHARLDEVLNVSNNSADGEKDRFSMMPESDTTFIDPFA